MKFTSLDHIIRSTLLQLGKPIHWYVDCMVYSRECFRELTFDDLQVINTQLLTVDESGVFVDLPCDYVDFVKVGIRVGQMVRPLVQSNSINPLHNYNSDGDITTYLANPTDVTNVMYQYPIGLFWGTTTINDYGENIGRLFGWGAGYESDTFKVLPGRNQIQLNESITEGEIVLQYISDGGDCDAATQVDAYAQATITSYIKWQMKCNSRSYGIGDAQYSEMEYNKQRQILRARKNSMTIDDLKRILQKNYIASPHI